MRKTAMPSAALWLTLSGLNPFVAPAVLLGVVGADPLLREQVALCLLVYSAVILSFLGGVRWGAEIGALADGEGPRASLLALSVLGSLAGWALVLLAAFGALYWQALALSALAHALHAYWDIRSTDLAPWFRRLRLIAATGAALSLALAAAAYALR